MTQSDHHPYPLLEAGVAWARRVVSFGSPSPRFKCLVSDDDDEGMATMAWLQYGVVDDHYHGPKCYDSVLPNEIGYSRALPSLPCSS